MEPMKGSRWDKLLREEQTTWRTLVESVKEDIEPLVYELSNSDRRADEKKFEAAGGTVEIGMKGTMALNWKWHGTDTVYSVANLDARRGGGVWTSEDVGNGKEIYEIQHRVRGKPYPIWKHKGYGPFVAVVGDRCYSVEAKKSLIYWRLVSWDAFTGKDERVHYEEKNYRYNLSLVRAGSEGAFLVRQAGPMQDAFAIEKNGTLELLEGYSEYSRRFVFGSNAKEYLVWSADKGRWRFSNELLWRHRRTPFQFPNLRTATPESFDTKHGLLVTRSKGKRTLWSLRPNSRILWEGYGNITIDPWEGSWIDITQPGSETLWWRYTPNTIAPPSMTTLKENRTVVIRSAESEDGTKIPYILVKPSGPSTGLLVIGYGAYGISTGFSTTRWEPLLKRGLSLAIGLWRGGGDHTPEWEDAGRLEGRERVLEDAEAVVRNAKEYTRSPAERTWLYGRSAGGLWVGGLIARYPKGDLAGGAYMEVPYLDVLRTITNRSLPLTDIETDEFGLPEQRVSDFVGALSWSPMEELLAGGKGTPGVAQIVRTGLNDSEVLAYESVKWVIRSRNGKDRPIFLAVEGNQGHFVHGSLGLKQKAEDLAILLKLLGL